MKMCVCVCVSVFVASKGKYDTQLELLVIMAKRMETKAVSHKPSTYFLQLLKRIECLVRPRFQLLLLPQLLLLLYLLLLLFLLLLLLLLLLLSFVFIWLDLKALCMAARRL